MKRWIWAFAFFFTNIGGKGTTFEPLFYLCLGSGISALFSFLGIFILLDNADKILKVLGIIILSIFVIAFIYGVFSNIVNIILDIRGKSRHRKWESYKRHAMCGNND